MVDEGKSGPWLTRRRLLIGTAVLAGGGLVLTWRDDEVQRFDADPSTLEPKAWLQLRPDGEIVVQVDMLEMGQGVMTGFVTLVAEELGVNPGLITARQAPVHPQFLDPSQTTGDSQSMRRRWRKLREVGAAAREMLAGAAADRWGADRAAVEVTGEGILKNRNTGEVLAYADVVAAAARREVPDEVELKAPDDFRWIGRRVERPDARDKVVGATTFGFDVNLPDQLIAIVVRCPTIGGHLVRFDAESAAAAAGVQHVFPISTGIAICAATFWHAQRAAGELDVEWSPSPLADLTVAGIHVGQREVLESGEMVEARGDGDAQTALAGADRVIEAEYAHPYLAHATMEPMNATVRPGDGRYDVWTASQSPDMTREIVASMTGLERSDVHMHVMPGGGGFGRRIMNDFVVEATEIAMHIGRSVKLLWSREDDTRHDWYHAANLHRLRGALDESGRPVAWEHRLVAPNTGDGLVPSVMATVLPEWMPDAVHRKVSDWSLAGLKKFFGPVQARDGSTNMPYAFDNVRVEVQGYDAGIPVGIWRSVGNHFNAFAVECFIDELAHAAGEDPAGFRRRCLPDDPRRIAVLDRLVGESGWGSAPEGRYQGMAMHGAYDSIVGQVAEVSVDGNRLSVHRVTCVIDCGLAINPDIVRQQVESGIIFGMTAALYGEIDFEDGRVLQSNFHDYRMVRMADAPRIDVHIIEGADSPAGIGEAATPPIAPAIANAVFAATGRRVRQLPIRL